MTSKIRMEYKIVLCGDGYVGKTALRRQYMGLGFSESYFMTLGADLSLQDLDLPDPEGNIIPHKFQIWDLTGQPTFTSVRPMYYKGAHAAIVVYDVSLKSSFENVINWVSEIEKYAKEYLVSIILLANKMDLKEKVPNSVSFKEGSKLAEKISSEIFDGRRIVHFMETSAKTGENVNQAFLKIIDETFNLLSKRKLEK
ncbi:MAG: Rab family GTPase [Candidatus Hodarchaeales archaeon]